jgi:ABC-type bacteriocin/lantibiotic exporter with double-glycine peptidase domain
MKCKGFWILGILGTVFSIVSFGAEPFQQPIVSLDVPAIKQPYMSCLVASVSMVLKYWGYEISPEQIGDQLPVYKDGTSGRDLADFVQKIGFRGFLIQPTFEDLLNHILKERPMIVSLPEGNSMRHALVLVGYDLKSGIVYLNDPAEGRRVARELSRFRQEWGKGKRWTFLILPK